MAVDPGFRTAQMLTFSVDPSRAGYDDERSHAFATALLDARVPRPGVSSAAYAFQSLLGGRRVGHGVHHRGISAARRRRRRLDGQRRQPRLLQDARDSAAGRPRVHRARRPCRAASRGLAVPAWRSSTSRSSSGISRAQTRSAGTWASVRTRHADANRDRGRGEGLASTWPSARIASPRFSSRICRRDSWRT